MLPPDWSGHSLESIARLAPVQPLSWWLAKHHGIKVSVKREDLLHPALGGNKFYKMHGHLKNMKRQGLSTLLTFGGAYSNHIYAVAAAGQSLGIETIGVIRGQKPRSLSPTLADAEAFGMRLAFVSREQYGNKHKPSFINQLQAQFGPLYCMPEGGGDFIGAQGCGVWAAAALGSLQKGGADARLKGAGCDPSHVAVACGTGATLAGVFSALEGQRALGFLALKGREAEVSEFRQNVFAMAEPLRSKSARAAQPVLQLEPGYHCGGYAKYPEYLQEFVLAFEAETGVPLDRVYTSKLFWGLKDCIEQRKIPPGSHILVLHSGGLQGNR